MKNNIVSMLALAAATPAFAYSDAPLDAPSDGQIVVTASGIEQTQDEVGQAITVIDADTIQRRQSVHLTDLLVTTPGVRFNGNGPIGGQTGVSIRGAEIGQTLVLLDGVKINDPAGIGDAYNFGPLMTGNIRQIEVLRGSNSVVHGSQAIGGVVNVVTGTPVDGFGVNASAEYGDFDTLSVKGDVSGSAGFVSGGIGAAYYRTDGISAKTSNSERDGYKNFAGNARLKLAFSDDISLDLRGYYINADLDYDGFSPALGEVNKIDQYVGYAGLNFSLFNGLFDSRAAYTYLRSDRTDFDSRGAAPSFGYRGKTQRFEYQGVVTPVEQVKLLFGYEHERPEYDYFGFGSTERARANIDSFYALAIVQPFAGLSVSGGARHSDHSQFGGATTFGANANYSPNGGATNLRASYGEGYRVPALYELYSSSGNLNLRPERSQSYDVGVDQSFADGKAVISITAFQRDTKDQIDYDVTLPPWGRYNNIISTRAKGVEATIALRPVEALNFQASYSYIDATDRSGRPAYDGNRLARRAENAVSVSVDYDWPFGLSTGATITVVGDSFNNQENTIRLDGYALAGIRASLPIGEHLEIYGRVDNLFDEQYFVVSGYNTFGRGAHGGVRVKF